MSHRTSSCSLLLAVAACVTPTADVGLLSDGDPTTTTGAPTTTSTVDTGTTTTDPTDATSSAVSLESSGSTADTGPDVLFDLGAVGTTGEIDECTEDAPDIIYVLALADFQGFSESAMAIWSFDPVALTYAHEVDILCPEILGQITGFSVARDGSFTILSWEPSLVGAPMQLSRMNAAGDACEVLFQEPVANLGCGDLSLVAADDAAPEQLFVHSCTGGGFEMSDGPPLGWLWHIEEVDDAVSFDLISGDPYTSVPLAGTGDGRLFGISGSQESPASIRLIEFDLATGARTETPTPEISLGDHGAYFAMAFYAGDFYTFGLEDGDAPILHTVVHRYDWDDDDGNGVHEVTQLPDADPLRIIAAASPTCIPITPAG